jgi:uncharacterized surface protein with fasciclin (FAS1) repeats
MNTRSNLSMIFTAIFAFIFIAGLNVVSAQGTVVDVISQSEDHTIFAGLLADTELDNVIAQPGPYTVVAPTDDAFEAMGDELDQIRDNPQAIQNIVIGHLFQGEVTSAEIEDHLGIEISEGDVQATNGVVHISNQVILGQ